MSCFEAKKKKILGLLFTYFYYCYLFTYYFKKTVLLAFL